MDFDRAYAKDDDIPQRVTPSVKSVPGHMHGLPDVLGNREYGMVVREAVRRFRGWEFNRTNKPVSDASWEAYANCFAAATGAKRWDADVITSAGRTDDFRHAILGEERGGNVQQDNQNQAIGRNFAARGFEPEPATRAAAATPGRLDTSAPVRRMWTPMNGVYTAPLSQGGSRLPFGPQPNKPSQKTPE